MKYVNSNVAKLTCLVRRQTPLWVHFPGGCVSFTCDDAPASSLSNGAPVLEDYGVRGTFYIATALFKQDTPCGRGCSPEQVVEAFRHGHEIGCHTHSHISCLTASLPQLEADVDQNVARLNELLPEMPVSFAYPYGDIRLSTRRMLARRFVTCRGINRGLNGSRTDASWLAANAIYATSFDKAQKLIDAAVAANAWVIFYTHDVRDDPSPHGCSPQQLAAIVEYAVRHATVRTIREVVSYDFVSISVQNNLLGSVSA